MIAPEVRAAEMRWARSAEPCSVTDWRRRSGDKDREAERAADPMEDVGDASCGSWRSVGLLGIVYGLNRGNQAGSSSHEVLISLVAGAVLIGSFVAWEQHAKAPMLPMRFFQSFSC